MTRRIQQFAIGILAILALLASSVSACTCPHHEVEAKAEAASCHHHSEMTEMDASDCLASNDDCVCAASEQNAIVKAETLKLKKHVALAPIETELTVSPVGTYQPGSVSFVKPDYLSDSFYELSPSRGPPARL